MNLGSLFAKPKTLASTVPKKVTLDGKEIPVKTLEETVKRRKPGDFGIKWPPLPQQQVKDYKAITTKEELIEYLQRCQETGLGGFDWETAASEETRQKYFALDWEEQMLRKEEFLKTPLDPWKADICTASISAAPHESRVVPISHKVGKVFEPQLSRDEARRLFLDIMDRFFFRNDKIVKIAVNLAFETKFAAKYAKYIMMPVADPLVMWVRCLQVAAPHKIEDPKKPTKGWGLKPATKRIFGVEMNEFSQLLAKHGAKFFDEIDASQGDGLIYSAEDADYAVQHYLYWGEVAKQIPMYWEWLHNIEMPFGRVIGLMEYWGMGWDQNLAQQKREEAEIMQEQAAEEIKRIAKETFDLDLNPGKSGKTGEVKSLIFDYMKLPAAKWSEKTGDPSLDEEALIDMRFMLENNLETIDEEKYLAVQLPEDWETRDPDEDPDLSKEERQAIRIRRRAPHPYKEQGLRLITQLENIQKYSTLLSSHIVGREKYLNEVSGRIHAGYSPFTETGRCNSFNPNGQNVPRLDKDKFGIRNFYVPRPGKILFFIDFSGFELRLMAWKSGDEVMIDIFRTGGDMHKRTASTLTGKPESEITKVERTNAKAGNFGISYGGTEHALQKTFKTEYKIRKTLDECLAIVNAVKASYPKIPVFQEEIALQAREDGYVQTIYGYIRMLPGINSTNKYDRSSAARQAANTPIQGSAADIMKRSQNEVYEEIARGTGPLQHGKTDMIAQIHDEIIFEMDDDPDVVEKACAWIKSVMEKPPLPDFPVPIEAEASVGYAWGKKMNVEEWLKGKRGV